MHTVFAVHAVAKRHARAMPCSHSTPVPGLNATFITWSSIQREKASIVQSHLSLLREVLQRKRFTEVPDLLGRGESCVCPGLMVQAIQERPEAMVRLEQISTLHVACSGLPMLSCFSLWLSLPCRKKGSGQRGFRCSADRLLWRDGACLPHFWERGEEPSGAWRRPVGWLHILPGKSLPAFLQMPFLLAELKALKK
ncbi:hypothetical protein P7K49_025689 [Saguinus oedipus]|uniref:Uncharacterized protein n=1 Tax=Saguinus oedipus TaxID=9490 RepID=A0ABQ9UIP5_SAGOE|nr:hypothetical protein P7K49_025689 [Saguinus oedipus]